RRAWRSGENPGCHDERRPGGADGERTDAAVVPLDGGGCGSGGRAPGAWGLLPGLARRPPGRGRAARASAPGRDGRSRSPPGASRRSGAGCGRDPRGAAVRPGERRSPVAVTGGNDLMIEIRELGESDLAAWVQVSAQAYRRGDL